MHHLLYDLSTSWGLIRVLHDLSTSSVLIPVSHDLGTSSGLIRVWHDLGTISGLSTSITRFDYELEIKNENQTIWVFCTCFIPRSLTLSQHMRKCKGKLIARNVYLKHASWVWKPVPTILLPNVKLVVNFIRSLICIIERLSITFTSNGKREFVPRDQVSPLLVVYCSLLLRIN